MAAKRTSSETLMTALEDVEDAQAVMIIVRHNDDITWNGTSDSLSEKLGLVEFVATCIRQAIIEQGKESKP